MEKVYNIYVDGKVEYQNISLKEEDATIEKFIDCISTLDADDHDKEVLSAIENGASIEIVDADEEIVIEISRIAIKTETFCTPWEGQLYCIDVCEDSEERTAWLYNSRYGIKMLMFCEDVKNDRDQFLDAVFSNLPEYIEDYHKL